jgi:hypothetical protein
MPEFDEVNGIAVLDDSISTLNGSALTGTIPKAQRIKLGVGTDGVFQDVDADHPFPVKEPGTYGYAAGAAAGSVDVPTGARVKRVSVLPGASVAATLRILGGSLITIPVGSSFDEQLPGDAAATSGASDVVIGGTAQAYYVSWVT